MPKSLVAQGVPSLAIASGATTPVPTIEGLGSIVWSTTLLSLVAWTGPTTGWRSLAFASVAKTTYAYSATVGTLVPTSAGKNLYVALVTGAGTAGADVTIYDNTSAAGTKIAIIPGNTAVGTPLVFSMFATNGMWIAGVTGNCAFTLSLDK